MSGCGCGCATKSTAVGGDAKQILEALVKSDKPCGAKDLAEVTGLDKKIITKQVAALKKQGYVDSPVRCKYGITAEGKSTLG